MTDDHSSFRHLGPRELDLALQDARRHTLALFDALAAAGYGEAAQVPHLPILNLPLWELGHIAWFAEWFVLREALSSKPGDAVKPSLQARADDWFDSNTVAHGTRWALALPDPVAIKEYCGEVLDQVRDRLAHTPDEDAALYPFRLVLAHEDMHGEALLYTLQTLGAAAPAAIAAMAANVGVAPACAEIACAGDFLRGGDQSRGFVFDNEKQAAPCRVAPFAIDAGLVSNSAYLAFMRDGGYQCPVYWSDAGRAWLALEQRVAPRYWQREAAGDAWRTNCFGSAATLDPAEPVRHVSLYEAQAYCSWAGRRLPTEEEWECAAGSGQPGFRWGELWEWTASPFHPYAGFAPDRYLEYSAPYFGSRQVLRGASFATPMRLRSPHFRNFYTPGRDDIFSGFRTCAL
ncbi:selenoneine synthase SenA [Telluria aromaticivorans]|uniref:selenoneine synthase SenA n=1 Tax=Telluria aromaticivorans TaxID=2725995 RepID=UPI001E2FA92A|nr:selenoneine synthase SenA [Telluria aromaticivorans]